MVRVRETVRYEFNAFIGQLLVLAALGNMHANVSCAWSYINKYIISDNLLRFQLFCVPRFHIIC